MEGIDQAGIMSGQFLAADCVKARPPPRGEGMGLALWNGMCTPKEKEDEYSDDCGVFYRWCGSKANYG